MDEKKKQIVLLSALGALVVGAGSYYFLIRDTGTSRQQVVQTGPAERKTRDKTEQTTERKRKTRERKVSDRSTAKVERKERNTRSTKTAERKKRRSGGPKKVKKKKFQLAG